MLFTSRSTDEGECGLPLPFRAALFVISSVLCLVSCASLSVRSASDVARSLKDPASVVVSREDFLLLQGRLPYMAEDGAFTAAVEVQDGKKTRNSRDSAELNGDLIVADAEPHYEDSFVDIALFLPTGQTFCTARWDGDEYSYESAFIERGFAFSGALLDDIIGIYSDLESLETLKGGGVLEMKGSAGGKSYVYTVEML